MENFLVKITIIMFIKYFDMRSIFKNKTHEENARAASRDVLEVSRAARYRCLGDFQVERV